MTAADVETGYQRMCKRRNERRANAAAAAATAAAATAATGKAFLPR